MTAETNPELYRIHIHHIGGRDGEVGGFPLNPSFSDDVHLHIYEADPSCVAQIEEVNRKRGHRFSVYDCVLADTTRQVELYMTQDPCGSSLRRPKVFEDSTHIKSPLFGDYLLGEAFTPVRTVASTATTLDAWADRQNVPVDVCNFGRYSGNRGYGAAGRRGVAPEVRRGRDC